MAHSNHTQEVILRAKPRCHATLLVLLAKVVVVVWLVPHVLIDTVALARGRSPNPVDAKISESWRKFREIGIPAGVTRVRTVPPEDLKDSLSVPRVRHSISCK